ncbi:MAG TPA: hypothetical protein VNM92_17495 [Thermoanaerobaculia bacterium]|nr:hypothetical protein [Thermoanaerobaculia bacterium]
MRLPVVIEGFLGETPVQISELGLLGARIKHSKSVVVGDILTLRFGWESEEIALECRVVRSSIAGAWDQDQASHDFQTGLRLIEPAGHSVELLHDLLSTSVTEELERRFAETGGATHAVSGDEMVRSKDAPFQLFRLDAGGWRQSFTFLPDQPERGFTVATGEDDDELTLLRRTYAQSGEEGRDLVKLFAELSVRERLRLLERSALPVNGKDSPGT